VHLFAPPLQKWELNFIFSSHPRLHVSSLHSIFSYGSNMRIESYCVDIQL